MHGFPVFMIVILTITAIIIIIIIYVLRFILNWHNIANKLSRWVMQLFTRRFSFRLLLYERKIRYVMTVSRSKGKYDHRCITQIRPIAFAVIASLFHCVFRCITITGQISQWISSCCTAKELRMWTELAQGVILNWKLWREKQSRIKFQLITTV